MICRRCLLRAAARRPDPSALTTSSHITTTARRPFSHTRPRASTPISSSTLTQPPRQGSPAGHDPPAATSTSAAQPFSTPLTPSPPAAAAQTTSLVRSSVPAGAPLKGLGLLKNAHDPVALPDDEYPAWLWGILAPKARANSAADQDADLFSKSKKVRRRAEKRARKAALLNPQDETAGPRVPLHEQSVDLPRGDGTAAGALAAAGARADVTKAMREKRRATIKEANFLRSMG